MRCPATFGGGARRQPKPAYPGFSLIELLVVIAIIAIMASLLLVALGQAKEQTRSTVCRHHMKQVVMGFLMYAEENDEYLPWPGGGPARANSNPAYAPDWCAGGQGSINPNLSSSWNAPGFGFNPKAGSIYPYVTSQPRESYSPTDKEGNQVYRCPSTGRLGEALRVNFSANGWMDPGMPFGSGYGSGNGSVPPKGLMITAVTDPSRKVLLVNEEPKVMLDPTFTPGDANFVNRFILHQGRYNVAFMDAHLEAIPSRTFRRMQGSDSDIYFNAGK